MPAGYHETYEAGYSEWRALILDSPVTETATTVPLRDLRGTMRKIADGAEHKHPAAMDDPAILTEITDALTARDLIG